MKFLITGGAGFIGSHLTDLLLKSGHSVIVLDNLSTGNLKNLPQIQLNQSKLSFTFGSILDEKIVDSCVKECDAVFHLAAAVGVQLIIDKPLESLSTNIRGSENVLNSCLKYDKRILVTSTSEIYGKNTSLTLSENDDRILGSPTKTRWSYSEAKAIEEMLAYLFWKEKNLPTIIVRLFNTVGPRQIGDYGMVIPRFVSQALLNNPITVYGDGSQKRCFCHVQDVVVALINLMLNDNSVGEAFNVGNDQEISILELAESIKKLTKSKSEIVLVPYEKAYNSGFEDMFRRRPSIKKIQQHINWSPALNLNDIISDVTTYFTK